MTKAEIAEILRELLARIAEAEGRGCTLACRCAHCAPLRVALDRANAAGGRS